jgi:hypothetical protein
MHVSRLRRTLAIITAAALLASLTAATVAAPASAAKPKCQGKTATIVGTRKGEVIRGTAKRDIIVAKGGNDRIYGRGGNDIICAGGGNDRVFGGRGIDRLWGQSGHDRLYGNAGPDFLAGQVGNDTLVGGIGVDTCFQGTGSGPVVRCERPAPPPPPGPSLIPLTGILAVAYSDIDGLDGYSTGDVMINEIVDTNGDGVPSKGDTIVMGRYPTSTNPGPGDFADWGVKSHVVDVVLTADQTEVTVMSTIGATHWWWSDSPNPSEYDEYAEWLVEESDFEDKVGASVADSVDVHTGSPSQPVAPILDPGTLGLSGDDRFIDVELHYVVP